VKRRRTGRVAGAAAGSAEDVGLLVVEAGGVGGTQVPGGDDGERAERGVGIDISPSGEVLREVVEQLLDHPPASGWIGTAKKIACRECKKALKQGRLDRRGG
jgi:hypothetical protein